MTEKEPRSDDQAADLRRRAEEKVGANQAKAQETLSPEETRRTLHELRVHQIELEMQNEELRRTQVELDTARARYFDLYDLAPVGYCTVSEKGLILEANLTAATLLGVARGELCTKPLSRFILKKDQDIYYRLRKELLETGAPKVCELRMAKKDGTAFWALLEATAVRDADGGPVCRAILSDITGRKQAEEALRLAGAELTRSNRELEQFTAVASHDLQEPLRQVVGFLQLLRDRYKGKLDETADEFIHYALDGGIRMSKMVRDLLAYARVDTRGEWPSAISCQEALDSALANLRAVISENSVRVTHDAMPTLVADGSQIAQLFQNLIGNALKFRREGVNPEIHVGARQEGGDWVLWVKDNGIGIPSDAFGRVFVAFQRLHGMSEYPGTGMGLAICKKIVERHRGRIWVESEVGKGSRFYFTIPNHVEDS